MGLTAEADAANAPCRRVGLSLADAAGARGEGGEGFGTFTSPAQFRQFLRTVEEGFGGAAGVVGEGREAGPRLSSEALTPDTSRLKRAAASGREGTGDSGAPGTPPQDDRKTAKGRKKSAVTPGSDPRPHPKRPAGNMAGGARRKLGLDIKGAGAEAGEGASARPARQGAGEHAKNEELWRRDDDAAGGGGAAHRPAGKVKKGGRVVLVFHRLKAALLLLGRAPAGLDEDRGVSLKDVGAYLHLSGDLEGAELIEWVKCGTDTSDRKRNYAANTRTIAAAVSRLEKKAAAWTARARRLGASRGGDGGPGRVAVP